MFRGWNGLWGNWNRRWVRLEYVGDGWYELTWRGSDFADKAGRLRVRDSVKAVDHLCELLNTEVVGKWREVPLTAKEQSQQAAQDRQAHPETATRRR